MLSAGIVRLPMDLSHRISRDDILAKRYARLGWLRRQGLRLSKNSLLLIGPRSVGSVCDRLTTTRATLNGHNASAWRDDVIRANGFDERMQYGGLDRELGERLLNAGIKAKQVRHRIPCLHLDHPRPYQTEAIWKVNNEIRAETAANGFTWTPYGIRTGRDLLRIVTENESHEITVGSNRQAA